jgi:hypothetical protein
MYLAQCGGLVGSPAVHELGGRRFIIASVLVGCDLLPSVIFADESGLAHEGEADVDGALSGDLAVEQSLFNCNDLSGVFCEECGRVES